MRDDFEKLINERGRSGPKGNKFEKGKIKDWQKIRTNPDLITNRESTSPYRRKLHRGKNFNFSVLIRFLEKNVGKKWDDIYSELRQNLSHPYAGRITALDVIGWYVELNTKIENDQIVDSKGLGIYDKFYVHPVTKLLCKNKNYPFWNKKYRSKFKKTIYTEKDGLYLREIKGIWYAVDLKPLIGFKGDETRIPWRHIDYSKLIYDAVEKDYITYNEACLLHGRAVFASGKRQLNSKEIKHYHLRDSDE